MAKKRITLDVAGREVSVSSPDKIYFPEAGLTKLDLVQYYQSVADGAVRGVFNRPFVMKRFVKGITEQPFFQKRAPKKKPEWLKTATLSFPSGRTAEEVVIDHPAALIWCANLGCIDLNPHPTRADDLDHPDELRIDLDPVPGIEWPQIRDVAFVTKESLEALGLVGWPKTSGSRGIHVYVRIERRWEFKDVRRAALAIARDVELRAPKIATSKWWKEERHGVFLDYNQNAKDRTVASAYSVRPLPDARVSAPVTWDELRDCDPADFTMKTMPKRYAELGDLHAKIDEAAGSLDAVLALSERHEADGMGDAPWPPHYQKQEGEGRRVMPSKRRFDKEAGGAADGEAPQEARRSPSGRRKSRFPLLIIAQAKKKEEALAGLDRWKVKHPDAATHLEAADVLVDAMRGRSSTWTRVRVNLKNVPEALRPPQGTPDPDYDPSVEWRGSEDG